MDNSQHVSAHVSNDQDSALDDLFQHTENEYWTLKADSFCTDDTALESFDPTTAYDSFHDTFQLEHLRDANGSDIIASLEDKPPMDSVSPSELDRLFSQERQVFSSTEEQKSHQSASPAYSSETGLQRHFITQTSRNQCRGPTTLQRLPSSFTPETHRTADKIRAPFWKNEPYRESIESPNETFLNHFSQSVNSGHESDDSEKASDRNSDRSFTSWDKQQREFAKPPKTANICLEDLKRVFHLERPQAEKALNLKRTTFSNLSRHFGISKWPYRTIRDVQNRREANAKILHDGDISNDKRRKLLEQQDNLKEVIDLIYKDPTESRDSHTLSVLLKIVEARKKGDRFG